jgi:superfamily I DNA/RNA helicase
MTEEKYVVFQIRKLISEGAKPDDFFILGASVKGINSNIRKMENALVEAGIPCFVPMMETDRIDDRVIQGKVVFSTFHTVKGRQRKYVFVMGFDNSYFTHFAKNLNPDVCPNTLYVACTRATNAMYILEVDDWPEDRPLKFLKMSHHEMKKKTYIHFNGNPQRNLLFCILISMHAF